MEKPKNESKQRIKFYHIILISIILCPFLILNSKHTAEKRDQMKLDKEAELKFNKILVGRNLESFDDGMNKVCNRGSDELKQYYSTGDKTVLGIEENNNENNENENTYALIDIIKGLTGDEAENETMENAKTYGMHVKGVLIFFVIAILSIPGWFICCSCCCCNCCCCCCCKNELCKKIFFIITMALYILVIAVCIYGLAKSNNIFEGLADTECSILKFCNEVIEGETKEQKPKWVGISGIQDLLNNVEKKINQLGTSKLDELNDQKENIITEKNEFEELLETNSLSVTSDESNKETIRNTNNEDYNYKLDITTKNIYGVFTKNNKKAEPSTSFMYMWYTEYSETAKNSEQYVGDATDNFNTVLGGTMNSTLTDANKSIGDIGESINEIKDGFADIIVDIADYIDDYGKMGFNIIFSVLMVIDAAIAVLVFLLCFFSGKLCNNCCCCRCIFKVLIHLLWNIFAFFMIITFLIGALFTLIGTIGNDMISVVNYFISEDNLGKENPTLFGSEGKKLNKCFNGEGDIAEDLGLNLDDINSLDELNTLYNEIETIEQQFNVLKNSRGVYNEMMEQLKERVDYTKSDFTVISCDDNASPSYYKFSTLIDELNNELISSSYSYKYDFTCNEGKTSDGEDCKHPKDLIEETSDLANRINKMKKLVEDANDETNSQNYITLTNALKNKYNTFLESEITTLRIFKTTINELTGIFDEYIGENGGLFDFINCTFIGNNIQVILKMLKDSLGGDFYSVGVSLLLSGCSMALSIIFTILLISIINGAVDNNKKED